MTSTTTVSHPRGKADTLSFAIRADRELYETFQRETRAQGMNPSVVIRQFIRSYNDGHISV